MLKQVLKYRVIIILCLVLVLCSSEAFAWGGYGNHYYRGGRWYRHGWLWLDTAVAALTVGAIVESLPPRYNTVIVEGAPYYYYDNYYYRPYPSGGYVVVPPPVLTQSVAVPSQPMQPPAQEDLTINIPNARGGYTAVTLRRAGSGYIGPQGEYYSDNPTVEQLRVLYGK